jgi:hypothetical protein
VWKKIEAIRLEPPPCGILIAMLVRLVTFATDSHRIGGRNFGKAES